MQNPKILLREAAIIAIVATALAFKTKYFNANYCYAPVPITGSCANVRCTGEKDGQDTNGGETYCYVYKTTLSCTYPAIACPNIGLLESEY